MGPIDHSARSSQRKPESEKDILMIERSESWMRGPAAFVLGVVLVFAVQIPLTRVWGALGVTWSAVEPPLNASQQFAALSTLFSSILVSTVGAALVARRRAVSVVAVLALLGILIDGYAMFVILAERAPLWFRVAFVGQIPLATYVGWLLVRRRLSSTASQTDRIIPTGNRA